MTTATDPGSHAVMGLGALLLADARLPVGSHTQSAGLEPAVLAGLTAAEVPAYVGARLRHTSAVDVGTAVVARHLCRAGTDLTLLHAHWAARTPSEVQRAAAAVAGRGYQRLARRLWPGHAAIAALDELPTPARPIVVGAMASILDVPARELAILLLHDEIQTIVAAALKLLPMDPVDGVLWTLAAHPEAARLADELAPLWRPADLPAAGLPLADLWLERHAHETRRLFRA